MDPVMQLVVGAGAIVAASATVGGATWARRGSQRAAKAVRLLEGESGQPGVIGRLDEVEDDVEELETTVDVVASGARTDGGEDLVELPDGATEADTERDGVLSYAGEVHALLLGIGAGLVVATTGRWEFAALVVAVALGVRAAPTPKLRQLTSEPWYAIGGLLIGMAVGYALGGVA